MKVTCETPLPTIKASAQLHPDGLTLNLKGKDSKRTAREVLHMLLHYRKWVREHPLAHIPAWCDPLILNLDQQAPYGYPDHPLSNPNSSDMKHLQQHNLKPYSADPDRNPFSDLFFTCGDLIYEPLPDFSEEADFQFEIHGVYQSEGKVFRFFQTYQDLLLGSDAFKNLKRATFSDETKFPSYFFLMNSLKKDETVVPLYIEARNPEVFREDNSL